MKGINLSDAEIKFEVLPASRSHSVYTVVGFAWPIFGFFFLVLLCTTGWFKLEPLLFFPSMVFAALFLAHLLATFLESNLLTSWLRPWRNGQPLLFYRRFIGVETACDKGETEVVSVLVGQRRILLSAVSELYLTLLGTLEIRSTAVSGDSSPLDQSKIVPDVVARLPLSCLDLEKQKRLGALFEAACPGLSTNKRLKDRLASPVVKGQMLLRMLGAMIITFALFDVSYATSLWLTMLRSYYGAQLLVRLPDANETACFIEQLPAFVDAKQAGSLRVRNIQEADTKSGALKLYEGAEALRTHPFPLSWAYRALFSNKNSQAQLAAIRAETLFQLGRKEEALALLKEAIEAKPSGFRTELTYARYLAALGRKDEAIKVMQAVLEKHKDVLLPRLYEMGLNDSESRRREIYQASMKELDEQVFGTEPAWPPGGERPIMEMWRRDDLEFLNQLLLESKAK
jgi:tetratricopeptide (TPR) repeat protein